MAENALAVVSVPEEFADEVRGHARVEVDEEALYDPPVAAIIVGINKEDRKARQNAMYRLPIPQIRTGPNGGRIRYLGRDLLRFREERREGGEGRET